MREENADVYRFDHLLLWDAVYRAQSDEQRRSRHERLAEIIGSVLPDYDRPPLGLRLEHARHLYLGGTPCLGRSAEARLELARTTALEGLSFTEAEAHCAIAIDALRRARPTPENDRRFVDAVEMQLSMTEVRWHAQHAATGGPADIDALAEQAERAAARVGALDLRARSALLRGKTQLATRGQEPALKKLAEAVRLADQHGDPVLRYVTTVEFGRHVSKRNLAEGLAALREAELMYTSMPQLRESDDPVLVHTRNLAEMQLGVTLFDSGFLEEALGRLGRCVDRLRGELLNANLPIAFNYLAQVQFAIGRADQAEATLREALEFEERRGGDSGWHANNAALLALVLSAERRNAEECRALIESAWLETERTWLLNLVPLVRNIYAEVLLALPRNGAGEAESSLLERAERLARETCRETEDSGMTRSRIAALCLSARVQLRMGRSTQAADFARTAVALLDRVGDMPALRTEEILYHAASVLWADGDTEEASALMDRASRAFERKAERIEDESLRRSFTDGVPLNRWVRDGLPAAGAEG
jgi:tetratricopeptide (TPR) repeat protein